MNNKIALIVSYLKQIFQNAEHIHHSSSGNQIVLANISSLAMHLGVIKLKNGYLIETSYPESTDIHNRLWMVEPQLLNISYLELTNPDLINNIAFDFYGNTSPNLEMHVMPEDINYLYKVLEIVVSDLTLHLINPMDARTNSVFSHPMFGINSAN